MITVPILALAILLIEIALLAKLVAALGFFATTALMMLSAAVGVERWWRVGLRAFERMIDPQRTPADASVIFMGSALDLMGAIFLILPGVLLKSVSILALIPAVKDVMARFLARRLGLFETVVMGFGYRQPGEPHRNPDPQPRGPGRPKDGDGAPIVIEGEFHRVDEKEPGERKT